MTSPFRPLQYLRASNERSRESLALAVGVLSFLAVAGLTLLVFRLRAAPISGPGSIGQFAAVASGAVAIVAFVGGRMVMRRAGTRLGVLDVIDIAALAFAHGVIALLSWTLVAVIMEQSFIGAEVFGGAGVALAGAAAAVTGYLALYSATHMDLDLLAVVMAVFLAEGIIASMLTASDPQWWEEHLSALGVTHDISSLAFNLTLIVAGVIVTTLARYATRDIPTTNPKGALRVRTCLVVVGVFLGCVGVFNVQAFFWIHTGVASGMAVAFGVLVVRLPVWIPRMPRLFVWVGIAFIGVILLLAVYYAVGFYTLTAVELVAGVLVFTWIILFLRNVAALQDDAEPEEAGR